MSDSVPSPQHPECSSSSTTVTLLESDEQDHAASSSSSSSVPTLTVKLRKPKTERKVQWSTETVDNEHLGRKKSKCCCIFNKPKKFGESSSSSDESSDNDECEHCQGHVEKKKRENPAESVQLLIEPSSSPKSLNPDESGENFSG